MCLISGVFKISAVLPTLTVSKPLVTEGTNGSQMEYMDLNHSADTLLFTLGQVVSLPQPLKDKQFFKMFKSAENGHI